MNTTNRLTALAALSCAALGTAYGQLTFSAQTDPGQNSPADNAPGVKIEGDVFFTIEGGFAKLTLLLRNTNQFYASNTKNVLTGVGIDYNTALFDYDHAILPGTGFRLGGGGTDAMNFKIDESEAFGGNNPSFNDEILSAVTNSPHSQNGLAGGYEAPFHFYFDLINGATAADFTAETFFSSATSQWDLTFRFQSLGDEITKAGGKNYTDSAKLGVTVDLFEDIPVLPEPSTYGLIGVGLLTALVAGRRIIRRRS